MLGLVLAFGSVRALVVGSVRVLVVGSVRALVVESVRVLVLNAVPWFWLVVIFQVVALVSASASGRRPFALNSSSLARCCLLLLAACWCRPFLLWWRGVGWRRQRSASVAVPAVAVLLSAGAVLRS